MHIAHIQGIFSPEHGGPCYSLANYCRGQVQQGHRVSVWALEGFPHTSPAVRLEAPVEMNVARVGFPAKLGRSHDLRRKLQASETADVYHLHGTWLRAMYYGSVEARRRARPCMVELMGMYDPYSLRQKWLQKWITRHWFQDGVLRGAACLHVNSRPEAACLRRLGFDQPMAVIPIGVDVEQIQRLQASLKNASPWTELDGRPFCLYLARVHEKKGIELLLRAWASLTSEAQDWQLLIVGAGEPKYVERCRGIAAELGIASCCIWAGAVSEEQKCWAYTHAAFYVLPTYSENFGNTVAEALAHGRPVLTTNETPWEELRTRDCGWLTEASVESVTLSLGEVLRTPEKTLNQMGERGRQLVQERYSLPRVWRVLEQTYSWLHGGPRPECVQVD